MKQTNEQAKQIIKEWMKYFEKRQEEYFQRMLHEDKEKYEYNNNIYDDYMSKVLACKIILTDIEIKEVSK